MRLIEITVLPSWRDALGAAFLADKSDKKGFIVFGFCGQHPKVLKVFEVFFAEVFEPQADPCPTCMG